ncbi:unnamed protein product [Rhizopus stolonifer]
MYTLSILPKEILYTIANFLDIHDLVIVARMNSWYGYWLSTVLSHRIKESVEKEGWRINIDVLAKSHPLPKDNIPYFPFSNNLLLLSEFCGVNPVTLKLEFGLCPIDDEGFGGIKGAAISEKSLVIFNKITTNINIVAYFAQISSKNTIKSVQQAGSALINDLALWRKLSDDQHSHGTTLMKSGFSLSYDLSNQEDPQMSDIIENFRRDYEKHKPMQTDLKEKLPATISFDKIYVTPEWWIKQMQGPTINDDPQDYLAYEFW